MNPEQFEGLSDRDKAMMGLSENKEVEQTAEPETKNNFEAGDRARLQNIAEQTKIIAQRFREREREGLNPLIDDREIAAFSAVSQSLEQLASSSDPKQIAEVEQALQRLDQCFNEFGNVPRPRMVRDDSGQLRRLGFGIRQFGEGALELKRSLGGKENSAYKSLIASLNRVIDSSERVYGAVMRRANSIDNYSGR